MRNLNWRGFRTDSRTDFESDSEEKARSDFQEMARDVLGSTGPSRNTEALVKALLSLALENREVS